MDKTDIIFNLAEILGCEARKYEPLSKHTTFKIGGVADTYVKVTSLAKKKDLPLFPKRGKPPKGG